MLVHALLPRLVAYHLVLVAIRNLHIVGELVMLLSLLGAQDTWSWIVLWHYHTVIASSVGPLWNVLLFELRISELGLTGVKRALTRVVSITLLSHILGAKSLHLLQWELLVIYWLLHSHLGKLFGVSRLEVHSLGAVEVLGHLGAIAPPLQWHGWGLWTWLVSAAAECWALLNGSQRLWLLELGRVCSLLQLLDTNLLLMLWSLFLQVVDLDVDNTFISRVLAMLRGHLSCLHGVCDWSLVVERLWLYLVVALKVSDIIFLWCLWKLRNTLESVFTLDGKPVFPYVVFLGAFSTGILDHVAIEVLEQGWDTLDLLGQVIIAFVLSLVQAALQTRGVWPDVLPSICLSCVASLELFGEHVVLVLSREGILDGVYDVLLFVLHDACGWLIVCMKIVLLEDILAARLLEKRLVWQREVIEALPNRPDPCLDWLILVRQLA